MVFFPKLAEETLVRRLEDGKQRAKYLKGKLCFSKPTKHQLFTLACMLALRCRERGRREPMRERERDEPMR